MSQGRLPFPIKILYLTSGPQLAGAERCLLTLVCHLDRMRFLPVVLVPAEGSLARELREKGIDVTIFDLAVLENKRELKSPKFLLRLVHLFISSIKLARLIRQEHIRLVHSNTSGVLVGAMAAKLACVPHIWQVREILEEPRWLWLILQWLIPFLSNRVICVSTAVREHFHVSSNLLRKMVVVSDAIDVESFVQDLDKSYVLNKNPRSVGYRVGMLARINPRKGHMLFVRAASQVFRKHPLAQFYIAGGCLPVYQDIKQGLENFIREHGMEKQVHVVGDLTSSQVVAFINQIDVLVLPSLSPEGFGLTLLEGMAFAKPVIAPDAGGPRDVILHGVTGLLVRPGDADALAEAIMILLEDDDLRREMGDAGKQHLVECFSLESNMNAIESIYDQCI